MTEWHCDASYPSLHPSRFCLALPGHVHAGNCAFEAQGEGHVAAVIDARSFRLDDGREIRLAGIEPADIDKAKGAAALAAVIGGVM